MRLSLGPALAALALCLTPACASKPLAGDELGGSGGSGGTGSSGGSPSTGGQHTSQCSAALRQSVSLVDSVATSAVAVLDDSGSELAVYVDATAGNDPDKFPWVYLSLATGTKLELTDIEALSSTAWDLAFKRAAIRTNSGDSGPGAGGAFKVSLPWDSVDASTLGTRPVPTEDWFDEDCNIGLDSTNSLITTFSGWDEYDVATHVLTPADAVYLTRGGDGSLYKVAVLDYYSNPNGSTGKIAARYKLRIASLP